MALTQIDLIKQLITEWGGEESKAQKACWRIATLLSIRNSSEAAIKWAKNNPNLRDGKNDQTMDSKI